MVASRMEDRGAPSVGKPLPIEQTPGRDAGYGAEKYGS
jgi:hypothetical protein